MGPFGVETKNERDPIAVLPREKYEGRQHLVPATAPEAVFMEGSGKRARERIQNQIDYILVYRRFGTSIMSTSTYPRADVPSDHILLLTTMKVKLEELRSATKK